MGVTLYVRNDSARKRLYRSDALQRRAELICTSEGLRGDVEISLLFCDDPFMASLNKQYRTKNQTTDVLSFEQPRAETSPEHLLGDIVISLETIEHRCAGDRRLMRDEVYLLFCHGLLHLLGYDHGTPEEQKKMTAKQARYLGLPESAAWGPYTKPASPRRQAHA